MARRTKTITFSLPPDMAERVVEIMKEEGRTMSELVREALRTYMHVRELRGTVHSRESLAHDEHALSPEDAERFALEHLDKYGSIPPGWVTKVLKGDPIEQRLGGYADE